MEDAIVCGGGPAGLAAALWLGRYRRQTVLLDDGGQRNLAARATHGYLSRDGASPRDLLTAARRDLDAYDTVAIVRARATEAARRPKAFEVTAGQRTYRAHRLVLATGVSDVRPDIPGFDELYGTAVFHCSCCDGFEARDHDVLAIGWGEHTAGFAIDLLEWGARVTLVTNGRRFEGSGACSRALARTGVELIEDDIVELCRRDGAMTAARLRSGRVVPATMAFFSIAHRPRTELASVLGCKLDAEGYVVTDAHGATSIEGVYAAGDVTPGEQLVQVAAAEGAVTGIACALSLRGQESGSEAPAPGPDPETEVRAGEQLGGSGR